jgi:hypothetical protein
MDKRELARDILALGSWVFYSLVVIRAVIGPFELFLNRLLIAAAFLLMVDVFYNGYDKYLARGLVLATFTCLFYENLQYSIFVTFLYVGMIMCSDYLGRKGKEIMNGIVFGLVASGLGYYLAVLA